MHVLARSRAELWTHPEHLLDSAQIQEYKALVDDRLAGHPVPHLTGRVEFFGLELAVTPEVLIPRHETELLVELALSRRPRSIVDVGTGSGCIAIALAKHLPDAVIFAIDISPSAVAVAQRNAVTHQVDDQIQFIVGDLLARRPGPVNLIVSNPPYVSTDEWASLPTGIRDHEPRLALVGGSDGFGVIRRLLSQSQGLLAPQGALLIEIGADQGEEARDIARSIYRDGGIAIRIHADLAGRDRVLEVQV